MKKITYVQNVLRRVPTVLDSYVGDTRIQLENKDHLRTKCIEIGIESVLTEQKKYLRINCIGIEIEAVYKYQTKMVSLTIRIVVQ